MTIDADLQLTEQDSPLVYLYKLDATNLGASIYRFTPHFADGGSVGFGAYTYDSIPIHTEGWEITSTGTQPRPTLHISNVLQVIRPVVRQYKGLVGAYLTRMATKAKFLNGGASPNSNEYILLERFMIEQKINEDKNVISWQLSSPLEALGLQVPREQITRDRFPAVGASRGWA